MADKNTKPELKLFTVAGGFADAENEIIDGEIFTEVIFNSDDDDDLIMILLPENNRKNKVRICLSERDISFLISYLQAKLKTNE